MTLKAIFNKPVDRAIEGVIKADDETSLRLEVEEYVLTNEIAKRLEAFLDAYNNYAGANGVWISGFFGSGKSHLLKMLALLLENRQIDEKSSLDLFLPKCGDNEILRGDLRRATSIPSHSILFNIDQKADVISKNQIDALLAVFVKVFDEMCGYYGKQGYIAQFERDLDSRGQYYKFKSAYESTAGRTWQKGREQALLEAKNIAKAYAQATDGDEASAMGILDRYRSQYRVSIEDFAEQVHAYIEQQSPNFRLNFFVDEVGQYIAENVKLMTNLQTIAESLATKCRGRAWIIVTAQADMELVVGEMNKQQGNDFSKIQDRFATRMKLTSANVEEVIQKRLLTKNSEGFNLLSRIYDEQSNNFRTLFDFSDGARIYKNFGDREHFIHSYPFIPYQFTLFQSAIQNLSQYNSFEGKHSSVGERSMLGVFQQVAIHIGNHEIGQLATFDLMFEGIRSTLRSNIQQAVIQAERHLNNPFAIRLLKALFLVKHVKEFKSSIHNLCILMQESFDQDLPLLRKQVEEALNLLEQQTYVQRNGELYEYLTDEEKDIEQEIKNTDVEASDVADELEKIVFDHIIKQRKIRYEESGQDYSFTRKLDDRLHGREYELAINIITPFHEHAEDASMMKMQNMGRSELMVLMPADERLMRDLLMYKRTDKYILQNISITQQETVTDLLNGKRSQNQDRYTKLQLRLHNLLGKARLFASGTEVEVSSENAQMRILRGFQELITLAYPNLRMLRGVQYTEDNIKPILLDQGGTLLGNNATALAESEQELLAFIQGNNRSGVRTTLKNLLEKFERKPYGWDYAAVLCNLASLYARGKVEIRVDSNLLEGDALVQALRNSHGHGNVILEPQVEFTAAQIRSLKEFFEDFFDAPPHSSEAKALSQETSVKLEERIHELNALVAQTDQYPFLNVLTPVIEKLAEVVGKPYTWHLTELVDRKDALLDIKENIIEPVRRFMNGSQKDIYKDAYKFLQNQAHNFSYLVGDEQGMPLAAKENAAEDQAATALFNILNDPQCFRGNRMQQAKTLVENLQKQVTKQIEMEVTKAKETVAALKGRLCGMTEFSVLNDEQQEQITRPFNEFNAAIECQTLIAVIRDTLRRFEESDYQRLLSQMTSWAQPAPTPEPVPQPGQTDIPDDGTKPTPPAKPEPRIEYVPSRSVKVSFDKAWLADETDVERYLESMREALLNEIRKGKRIQI